MQRTIRILLLIVVPPVLLFGLALFLMWVPLPGPFPVSLSNGRSLLAAVTVGVLGAGYVIGLAVYVVRTFRQAGRTWDPLFGSLGLTAQDYRGFGRHYHGNMQGRNVEASFLPSRMPQRALLNIYVSASPPSRAAVGRGGPLLDCRDCARVEEELGLGDLHVHAEDVEWILGLLADSPNRSLLNRLMADPKQTGSRELYVQPDRIWLRAHPLSHVTGDEVRQWFDDLLKMAEVVEAAERG